RQRPLGPPTVARAPHSHDRAQPPQPPESDPGPSRVAPLLSSLENRTPFRLAAQLPSARNSLGVLRSQLPRDAPTRLPYHPPEEFMRCVLDCSDRSTPAIPMRSPSWFLSSIKTCAGWRPTTCAGNAVSTLSRRPLWFMKPICASWTKKRFIGKTEAISSVLRRN